MVYCTLFDSNYLDKGVVMIQSLLSVDVDGKIYVLCMDQKCKEVMDALNLPSTYTISLNEFEDDELLSVKPYRSKGEYCWTCTAKLIKFVILHFQNEICTYVDSDLFFYNDPSVLISEMLESKCSVQVISHRFPNTISGRYHEKENGRNCVQFNTFQRRSDGMILLDKWIQQCINHCSVESAGDQKYTDSWSDLSFVNVSKNGGAGIAPWNITRYKYVDEKDVVYDRYEKQYYQMIFYHFQNVTYLNRYTVKIMPIIQHRVVDRKLLNHIYIPYLLKIEEVKSVLEKEYGVLPQISVYISNSEKKRQSVRAKIQKNLQTPIPVLFAKMGERIRMKTRMKDTIINLSEYVDIMGGENDNAE